MANNSRIALLLLFAAGAGQGLHAQTGLFSVPGLFNQGSQNGFHLYSATSFLGYTSKVLPTGTAYGGDSALGGDIEAGGSATAGFNHFGAKSNFTGIYTISYLGRVHYSDWNALNHSLALNYSRTLAPKWRLSLSANGGILSLDQFLFMPTQFSTVAALPATFDDLAAAMVQGQLTNNQLASVLTGAPVVDSPATSLLFGNRFATAGVFAGLNYSYSPRLTLSLSAGANETTHLNDPATKNLPQQTYLLGHGRNEQGSFSLSYSLSPRTSISASVSEYRGISSLSDSDSTSASVSVSRTMGQHWFGTVTGGIGYVTHTGGFYKLQDGKQTIGGGTLGYKTRTHTFLAAYSRSVMNLTGYGNVSQNYTGSWSWMRPGSKYGLHASSGYQDYGSAGFEGIKGWVTSGGVTRALTREVGMFVDYSYLANSGTFSGQNYDISANTVRVSFSWTPGGMGHRL